MEIMRRGRIIMERRALPHSLSSSIGVDSSSHPPRRPIRRGSPAALPSLLSPPTRPWTARASRSATPSRPGVAPRPRPATPVHPRAPTRPRAPRTVQPASSTPLSPVSAPRSTYIPSRGLGERVMGLGVGTSNVSFTNSASRDAYQAARQARTANDRLNQNVSSPSRRRARSPSDDSDSDDQPLCQRRRRLVPRVIPDSSPSSIPSPPRAADFTPSHQVIPPPIPSHADDLPIPSSNQTVPPLAQPFRTQHTQGDEAGPSTRPSTVPPAEPLQGPSSAPSGATAEPSATPGSAVGPSGPPPLTYQDYCTTFPSEAQLWSQTDVPTSSLKMKGRLATLWEENTSGIFQACAESLIMNHSFHATHHQNKMLQDHVAELELQLNDPAQASHALRAEIKSLTSFRASKSDGPISSKVTCCQGLGAGSRSKLKSQEVRLTFQETQLASQATELATARSELAQARATTEGVSTALALYREGENDRCLQHRAEYLRSPEFCAQVGHRFSTSAIYGAGGALRQLHEQDYLRSIPPPEFLDHDRIIKEIPDEIFAPFD
ncbi:formin-like protein 13 [Zingiber officinale]|uniref:formin-like protein 13 n=1 Tax=Zingiber officinale TaxID=94328 RepID=UPI001C4CE63A|nr:formin-like protein 13 [Zingiber officinale]